MKIKYATISKMPLSLFDPMPEVTAHYEDGSEEVLFQYYPDEIRFTPSEFVGLTREGAFALRHQKDTNYLQN